MTISDLTRETTIGVAPERIAVDLLPNRTRSDVVRTGVLDPVQTG